MLHHFAVDFFSPVQAVGFEENDTLKIYGVSDLSTDFNFTVTVKADFTLHVFEYGTFFRLDSILNSFRAIRKYSMVSHDIYNMCVPVYDC